MAESSVIRLLRYVWKYEGHGMGRSNASGKN